MSISSVRWMRACSAPVGYSRMAKLAPDRRYGIAY